LLEIDVTFSKPETLEKTVSIGRVRERSTSSGPAPVYDVITTIIGKVISGYRSMGRFIIPKRPRPISSKNIMKIVVGRATTPFTMLIFNPLLE
jgi:hypothetical protein